MLLILSSPCGLLIQIYIPFSEIIKGLPDRLNDIKGCVVIIASGRQFSTLSKLKISKLLPKEVTDNRFMERCK